MSASTLARITLCLAVVSCGSNDDARPSPIDAGPSTPSGDAGTPSDAGASIDACSDCARFPPDCGVGRFCPVDAGFDRRARLRDISGTSATDVWTVGSLGTVLHYDGQAWTPSVLGTKDTLTRISIRDDGEIWATSSLSTVYVRSVQTSPPDGGAEWRAIVPMDPDGVVYSGAANAMWSVPASTSVWFGADLPDINIIRMRRSNGVIAVDTTLGAVQRAFGRPVLGMHGGANEVWAVGASGSGFRIANADSDAPVFHAFNTQTHATLHAVWVVAPDDVWAVGTSGTVRRYRGAGPTWDVVAAVATTVTLRGVWASSPSDVWVVGDGATIVHFDGTGWTQIPVGALGDRRPALYAVWGADPRHVWVSGDGILLALDAGGSK